MQKGPIIIGTLIGALAVGIGIMLSLTFFVSSPEPLDIQTADTTADAIANLPDPEETTTTPSTDWPVYITTMTHMEGGWEMAATNEDFFSRQSDLLRNAMDIAEEYNALLTFETEVPYATGMITFDDNVFAEALERGHGVGSHCDITPQEQYTDDEMTEEIRSRTELVDQLVGSENNRGCSGAGGVSNWYAGAVGAGINYLNGLVGFHYLALPIQDRPSGWNDRAILADHYHDASPVEPEKYYYPFLISELGFEEDIDGDLLLSAGSIGNVSTLAEVDEIGDYETDCGHDCLFTVEDSERAVTFIRSFVEEHDGSRPGKLTFYFPSATFGDENSEALHAFFAAMQKLVDEGLVEWETQLGIYNVMMQYYDTVR